jgi:hypothetical protein
MRLILDVYSEGYQYRKEEFRESVNMTIVLISWIKRRIGRHSIPGTSIPMDGDLGFHETILGLSFRSSKTRWT